MAGIIPRRGTRGAVVLTFTKVIQYAVINTSADFSLFIRNEASDTDANSTEVPAGASFSSPANTAYYQDGYTKVVIDASAGASFSFEAISELPT